MTVTSRCNYAGPLGKLIPTRSFGFLFLRLREGVVGRLLR
jgi:hypothetical protein